MSVLGRIQLGGSICYVGLGGIHFEKGSAASALMASHDVTLCIWWRYRNPDNALDASVLVAIYSGEARASCFQDAELRMNIVVLRRGSGCSLSGL